MTFWNNPVNTVVQWLVGVLSGWGVNPDLADTIVRLLGAAILPMVAMLIVIFLIWYERKIYGRIQDRFGPNRTGPFGLFQPFADMVKIFTKEYITPEGIDPIAFNLAPVLAVGAVLLIWAVVPFTYRVYGVDLNVGALYLIAAGSIGSLAIILAGWSSHNKYALLGAFRAIALLISYEVPMVLAILIVALMAHSLGINQIVLSQKVWFIILAPVAAFVFLISSIAEVGRAPFDLTEAESEIVAGFNIEYTGLKFGMFYVGEFLHSLTISILFVVLFLGGWGGPGAEQYPFLGLVYFAIKTILVYFVPIFFRVVLPRLRIDQMMDLNWKFLTPMMLVLLMVMAVCVKLVAQTNLWIQVVVLLGVNLLIGYLGLRLLGSSIQRRIQASRVDVSLKQA